MIVAGSVPRAKIYGPSKQLVDLEPDKEDLVPIAQDIAIVVGTYHIGVCSLRPYFLAISATGDRS